MFVKISKAIIVVSILFLVVIFTFYLFYKTSFVIKKINNNDTITCSVLLYSTGNISPNLLNCYQVSYNKNDNCLKVLSINTDIVLLRKYKKVNSLKNFFYENLNKGLESSIENLYTDLSELLKCYKKSDFYINMSFESFLLMMADKDLNRMILEDDFSNKDLKSLNNLDVVERTLKLMPYKAINVFKQYNLVNTNISKMSFLALLTRFATKKPLITFCELPVKYTTRRVELDVQNAEEFLNKVYYVNIDADYNNKNFFVDIKNASGKPRMAQKVTKRN